MKLCCFTFVYRNFHIIFLGYTIVVIGTNRGKSSYNRMAHIFWNIQRLFLYISEKKTYIVSLFSQRNIAEPIITARRILPSIVWSILDSYTTLWFNLFFATIDSCRKVRTAEPLTYTFYIRPDSLQLIVVSNGSIIAALSCVSWRYTMRLYVASFYTGGHLSRIAEITYRNKTIYLAVAKSWLRRIYLRSTNSNSTYINRSVYIYINICVMCIYIHTHNAEKQEECYIWMCSENLYYTIIVV